MRPFGFHLTNLVLHAINVLLVFHLMRRLWDDQRTATADAHPKSSRVIAAFCAAALFAVHPVMTEAVGYVSGRSEVLSATLFLLAVLAGRRWLSGGSRRWAAATVGLWVAALSAKETAVMLPFVLFAYDRLALTAAAGERRRRNRTIHFPLVAATVVAALVRVAVLKFVEYPGQTSVHWSLVPLAADVVRRYLWLLVLPTGQTIFHEVVPVTWIGIRAAAAFVTIAAVLGLAWRIRRDAPVSSLGTLWFFLLLAPQSMLTLLDRGEPMAEHRVYLASIGAFLAVGAAVGWLAERLQPLQRRIGAAALALVLASFGAETIWRNALWADPIDLWRESVDLAPFHDRPRLLLGEALQDAGRREEALEQYRVAILRRPDDSTGYAKLGLCLAEMGRFAEAAQAYKQIEQLDARSPLASNGLGTIAMLTGQSDRAREYFHETIARDPRNIAARQSLAILAAGNQSLEKVFGFQSCCDPGSRLATQDG